MSGPKIVRQALKADVYLLDTDGLKKKKDTDGFISDQTIKDVEIVIEGNLITSVGARYCYQFFFSYG